MKKMNKVSRILTAVASLALVATFFLPVWAIYLQAPQYPEGLAMQIWLSKLTGQISIINGLNHYIGMKHINEAMFPEFGYLVYIVGFFIFFGLVVALTGHRKLLFCNLILLALGGVAALGDFYKWGYDYGHNLDPHAAIQIPGFTYQPPVLGHKKLLNFDAYSYPDSGAWVVIVSALLLIAVWAWEKYRRRPQPVAPAKKNYKKEMALATMLAVIILTSCSVEPQKITYGKDSCDECMMTIMDAKFGGEIITKKGKIYKFDDAHCLVQFLKSGKVKEADVAKTVFLNHQNADQFLDVRTAQFVVSPQLKSPMNGNAAAFENKTIADSKATETGGKVLDWNTLYNSL